MSRARRRSPLTVLAIPPLLIACASANGDSASNKVGALPTTWAECVAAGGEREPASQGGRCFFYTTPRRDPSAYIHCRESGGVMGVAGRGMARETTGQSHVCTLVFSDADTRGPDAPAAP